VVNTHLHSDHCGGNAALQRLFPTAKTLIPPGQAADVKNWNPAGLGYVGTGQYCEQFTYSDVLAPGSQVSLGGRHWSVYAAEGHDPHSVVLFEPLSRVLISADALWEDGFGVVFPELDGSSGFDAVEDTLSLIESLNPAVVIPGHGAVFNNLPAALASARSRLAAFKAAPLRHASHGAKVLVKFKLLELQQVSEKHLLDWAQATSYFGSLHQKWFPEFEVSEWIDSLVEQLARAGVARRHEGIVYNV